MSTKPIDDLSAAIKAAREAVVSGDVLTARRYVTLAKLTLAEMPTSTGADGVSASWQNSIAALESAIDDLMSQQNGGFVTVPVEFHR